MNKIDIPYAKTISIVTPCFNEVENIEDLSERIKDAMELTKYSYEHIFIDNSSTDGTVALIKKIAKKDYNKK